LEIVLSSQLAYFIGAYLSDGCMMKNFRCMRLSAVDYDFVMLVKLMFLEICNKNPKVRAASRRCNIISERLERVQYVVDCYDKNIGLYIKNNDFIQLVKLYPDEFLGGLFDGDGCVSYGVNKKGMWICVDFAISEIATLLLTKRALNLLGIGHTIRKQENIWRLRIRNNGVEIFYYKVKFRMQRKLEKMRELINFKNDRFLVHKLSRNNSRMVCVLK